jgi:hypothetical protein
MKRKAKKAKVAKRALPERETIFAEMVESPVPHLLLRISGVFDEQSAAGIFERLSARLTLSKAKRVLVDMRDCRVSLTISDMHGLVKMIAGAFVGSLERLSVLLQARDILPEKFFEPALSSRGLPTLVTADYDEAVYWISSRLRPGL